MEKYPPTRARARYTVTKGGGVIDRSWPTCNIDARLSCPLK
jgi:hypothetical protein